MTVHESRDDLVDLLKTTGRAHHAAFIETDGFDPQWAEWYARHLVAPLRKDYGFTGTAAELAAWLRATDEAHRADEEASWPDFYAAAFRTRG